MIPVSFSFFLCMFLYFSFLCYVIYFAIINFCKNCSLSIVLFIIIIIYYKWITAKWLTHGKQLQGVVVWGKLENPSSRPILIYFEFRSKALTHYCHLHGPSLAQQIICDKILFSHTRRWYEFLFLYFLIFPFLSFFLLSYVIVNFYKNDFIIIIYFILFSRKLLLFFHVPGCFGMFRNVPCSGFYRRPAAKETRPLAVPCKKDVLEWLRVPRWPLAVIFLSSRKKKMVTLPECW